MLRIGDIAKNSDDRTGRDIALAHCNATSMASRDAAVRVVIDSPIFFSRKSQRVFVLRSVIQSYQV